MTQKLRAVIKHRDCALTGVVIINQGRSIAVPTSGGIRIPSGVSVEVNPLSGDVTFTSTAKVGNN